MSFHRSGAYAVNLGLDSDNVLRVGGWSAPANLWQLNMSGDVTVASSSRAPIFYDSNNTGYYTDQASTSNYNRLNLVGFDSSGRNYSREWIEFPNASGLYSAINGAHFYPNNGSSYGSWNLQGTRNGWAGIYFSSGGNTAHYMLESGNGGLYFESQGRWANYYSHGNNCTGFGTSTTSATYGIYVTKGGYFDGRVDGTVFYDANNTSYYLDPASTQSLRTVGDWRADDAGWTGEFSGKMQYHSTNWYIQYSGNAIFRNSGGTNVMTCDSSGNVTFSANVTAYSDVRLKENVVTIDSALDKVLKLRGVYYNKIGNPERRVGVIAQEIEAVLPEVVRSISDTDPSTGETTELLAVDYGNITGLLIEAVKELSAQLDALKKERK